MRGRLAVLAVAGVLGSAAVVASSPVRAGDAPLTESFEDIAPARGGRQAAQGIPEGDDSTARALAVPGSVGDVEVFNVETGRVWLRWSAVVSDPEVTFYEVQYQQPPSTDWVEWDRTLSKPTAVEEELRGLTDHQLFGVRVRAVNTEDNGPWSTAMAMAVPSGELSSETDVPADIASDGTTLWVVDRDQAFSYSKETGAFLTDGFDYTSGHDTGLGMCLHHGLFWIADYDDARIYAYDETTRTYDSSASFDLHDDNATPTAVACHDGTIWVGDHDNEKMYAYDDNAGARVPGSDIELTDGFLVGSGAWTDGATVWIIDPDGGVRAYDVTTGTDVTDDYGIADTTVAGVTQPSGAWSDGTTLWITDIDSDRIYQFLLPLTAPGSPTGLSALPGDGSLTVSWSAPATGGLPAAYGVRHRLTSADDVDASYTQVTRVDDAATSETITGLTNGTPYTVQVRAENTTDVSAWVPVERTPAVPVAPGAPVKLDFLSSSGQLRLNWDTPDSTGTSEITAYEVRYRVAGTTGAYTPVAREDVETRTELITGLMNYTVYEVQVAARNDSAGLGPYATIARAMPTLSWSTTDTSNATGLWSDGTTAWVVNSNRVVRGYALSDFSRAAGQDLDTFSLNPQQINVWGICSDGTTTWVLRISGDVAHAYERSGGSWSYVSSKDIDLGDDDFRGLWCNTELMLASVGGDDTAAELWAYDLPDGERNPSRDVDTQLGEVGLSGLWSDGLTAWLVDPSDGSLLALSMLDGAQREWLDIDTLSAAGNNNPRGIWANDDYMWVVDRADRKVYRYPMPQYVDGPPVPVSAEVSADGMTVKVTFTEALATDVVPDATQFKVVVGSAMEVSPSSVAHTSGDDTSVTLTLSAAAGEGVAVTVAYDDPVDEQTMGVVQDAGGADAPSFTKLSATPRAVTVPGVPTGLAAAPGAASLMVSWSAPATGGAPATYEVQYRVAGTTGAYTPVIRSNDAATSETISGLVGGTPYTVQVRTMNTAGDSAWVSVAGTPAVPATPSAPLDLSFVSRSGQLELSWEAPSSTGTSEITAYEVQYRVAGTTGAYTPVTRGDDTALSETVTSLVNYTVYEVQVAARNSVGLGPYATIARARPVPSFSLGSTNNPRGVWSDGTTVWVVHRQSVSVMVAQAYSLSDFSRVVSEDLPISTLNPGNSNAFGICSDGTTTWVSSELNPGGLFAYGRNAGNEWEYRSSDNIRGSGLLYPWAVSCDEESLLVVQDEFPDTEIWGYTLPGRTRNESADITPHAGNANITGLWANAAIAWVNDAFDKKLYAYARSDGSRIATLDLDYSDSGIDSSQGVWSDGTDVWIVENERKSVFKFPLPQSTDTTAPEVMVEAGSTTNSFMATDGDLLVNATKWRYAWIAGTAACNSGTPFPAANTYTEATDLSYTVDQNTMRACFRSADTSSNSGYGESAVVDLDVTAPEVTVEAGSAADTFKATDKDSDATTWHLAWIANTAACNNATTFPLLSNYSEGDNVMYTASQNTMKACFQSTDESSNSGYGESAVVDLDVTAPEVTVEAGSAANSFKATDKDSDATTWHLAWIASTAACNNATTFPLLSNYSEGDNVVYTASQNTMKACFQSTDASSNSGYGVSQEVYVDVDAPEVTVQAGSAADSFKATDKDSGTTTWHFAWIASTAACNNATTFPSVSNYSEGDDVTYTDSRNDQKLCFRSTDTESNAGYGASGIVNIDTDAPEVTVEAGSTADSFKATDKDSDATTWHFAWIAGAATCGLATTFPDANTYSEAADLSYTMDQNTMKACFRSTDASTNSGYGASLVVDVDVDAPEVTVQAGSAADTFKATDKDSDATTWHYTWIASTAACNNATTFPSVSNYSEGDDVTYTDSHNGQKLCFRSTDTQSNAGYGASGIVNIDTDAPVVSVAEGSEPNTFRATDDDSGTTVWHYAWIANEADCDSTTTLPSANGYDEGDDMAYTSSRNGQKLCFRSTDTHNNSGYRASEVVDISVVTTPVATFAPSGATGPPQETDTVETGTVVEFDDVAAYAYYAPAVAWMVENSITTGCDAESFCPEELINRQQLVVFIWRAAGEPEPDTPGSDIFEDVTADTYSDAAIGWAHESGITLGCNRQPDTPRRFCTRGLVTRAQLAALLYRYILADQVQPPPAETGFNDVDPDAYYAPAVAWMVQRSITTGCEPDIFCSNDIATRAHVATFMHRIANNPQSWGTQGILRTPDSN